MDATGLAIALVHVYKRLYETIESMKDAPKEAKQLQSKLLELQWILDSVGSIVNHISSATLQALKDEVNCCFDDINGVNDKLEKSGGMKEAYKRLKECLKWSLNENTTQEYISKIHRLKGSLILELQDYQIYVKLQS
ncbi:hypothetical protein FPQ18DRAFT_304142 [Pyronema domesticum]|nr:hypothetical protein FPQ18DRAFT_304142 [Pyronema domesticum]